MTMDELMSDDYEKNSESIVPGAFMIAQIESSSFRMKERLLGLLLRLLLLIKIVMWSWFSTGFRIPLARMLVFMFFVFVLDFALLFLVFDVVMMVRWLFLPLLFLMLLLQILLLTLSEQISWLLIIWRNCVRREHGGIERNRLRCRSLAKKGSKWMEEHVVEEMYSIQCNYNVVVESRDS